MAVAKERFDFSSIPVFPPIVSKKVEAHHRLEANWIGATRKQSVAGRAVKEGLLVGPAERYSVGNLLIPHVLARVLDLSKIRCAGMARADHRDVGGFPVRNYGESALEMGGTDLQLIHFGGTALTEDIVEAYSSVTQSGEAERFESLRLIGDGNAIRSYVRRRTGQLGDLAYFLAPEGEFFGCRTSFLSVGLSRLTGLAQEPAERLLSALEEADFVGVQDSASADLLEKRGINAHRMPCALSVLSQVCARQLQENRDNSALAEVRHRFPNGWIAVEVGDLNDCHFERLGQALHDVSDRDGLGLVFFDASAKEPTSENSKLRRWVEFHPEWEAAQFSSSNIWDVANLLLHARLYCGGNLDCRILAMGGGISRINVPVESEEIRGYCDLWESTESELELDRNGNWSEGLSKALRADYSKLAAHSQQTGETYFAALQKFSAATAIRLSC